METCNEQDYPAARRSLRRTAGARSTGMKTKKQRYSLFIALLLCLSGAWMPLNNVYAGQHMPTVQYGAYCRTWRGEIYRKQSIKDAIQDMRQYFQHQGLDITNVTHDSRFIRADITDKTGEVVDSVLLDSWTGRMRSVF